MHAVSSGTRFNSYIVKNCHARTNFSTNDSTSTLIQFFFLHIFYILRMTYFSTQNEVVSWGAYNLVSMSSGSTEFWQGISEPLLGCKIHKKIYLSISYFDNGTPS